MTATLPPGPGVPNCLTACLLGRSVVCWPVPFVCGQLASALLLIPSEQSALSAGQGGPQSMTAKGYLVMAHTGGARATVPLSLRAAVKVAVR